jgi:hypothetical protein
MIMWSTEEEEVDCGQGCYFDLETKKRELHFGLRSQRKVPGDQIGASTTTCDDDWCSNDSISYNHVVRNMKTQRRRQMTYYRPCHR